MTQKKLNGSADLLAQAIRRVFEETSESVKEDMHEMEKNLSDKIDTTNKTTNQNMQFQFAEQEKKIAGIGKMIKAQSGN